MTDVTKRQVAMVCLVTAIILFIVGILGRLMIEPQPPWSNLALAIAPALTIVGIVLSLIAKKAK
jgi:hypothetical protein